jgi:Uma2 family endonuclease
MSTRTTDYREAIGHLPDGATIVVQDVSWQEYEKVLADLLHRPGVRVTYDQGRLEIVSPLRNHEKFKEFITLLVRALADELQIDVEFSGSTTWRRKQDAKGTEPDTCFHLTKAREVIGKDELDLDVDPPPDVVVEIGATNESLSKFPIYLTFGVPEIWRYEVKRKVVVMYGLTAGAYSEIKESRCLPILTPPVLAKFLEQSTTKGQTAALVEFRKWARQR